MSWQRSVTYVMAPHPPWCDRGRIYCSSGCSREARRESLALAARQYRSTAACRINNRERQQRYRRRRNQRRGAVECVTHHGSTRVLGGAILGEASSGTVPDLTPSDPNVPTIALQPATPSTECAFCSRTCQPSVRQTTLGRLNPSERRRLRRARPPPTLRTDSS